ncbi:MAG: hypothetical protein PF508_03500 [Spirochaeta sp.]|jgi:hypothetical protein|nr:hypothetical protein [Spirochaeta sp.]
MKTSEINSTVLELAVWLQDKCDTYKYGTFEIGITVHAGNITKVTYSATETVKPNNQPENGRAPHEKHSHR